MTSLGLSYTKVHALVILLNITGEFGFTASINAANCKGKLRKRLVPIGAEGMQINSSASGSENSPGPISQDFVVSVVNLYLQEMQRNKARRSAVPFTQNGKPCKQKLKKRVK